MIVAIVPCNSTTFSRSALLLGSRACKETEETIATRIDENNADEHHSDQKSIKRTVHGFRQGLQYLLIGWAAARVHVSPAN